ncbi:MAG: tRNA (adenosine(37)-N6)-threonylcarbamoyltransferase complex ATPase subunit type 1 TsaE [Bacteroidota bacterium]
MKHTFFTLTQNQKTAKEILDCVSSKTLAFHGPMGSGKTTLIKAIIKELGASDTGNSPSFGIVNEYHDDSGALLAYHFDFYRLEDETEALDLGLEDYLDQDVWIFMEWPEKIASLLPVEKTVIQLEILDKNTRKLAIRNDFP